MLYVYIHIKNFDKNDKANTENFHILHTQFFLIVNILISHNHMRYFSPLMYLFLTTDERISVP